MKFTDKYQPKKPSQIIGKSQKKVAENLSKIATGIDIQPIILVGPSGSGKTTLAKMFASMLEEERPVDLIHINCSDKTGVNEAREYGQAFKLGSLHGGYRVYFLDEVHDLTKPAQKALLLPLEEGLNPYTVIIVATTEEKNLIDTFRSRFSRYYLEPPTKKEMEELCFWISKKENFELDNALRDELIVKAEGNVRNLVTFLEQVVMGTYTSSVTVEKYQENVIGMLRAKDIVGLLKVDDYNGTLVGICTYAIKALGSGYDPFYARVLQIFGKGLHDNLPQNIAWANLVVNFVDNN